MRKLTLMLAILLGAFASPAAAQTPAPQTFWWNDRVFYEIFVRSFNDSDGDGIGDLQGIIDRLDYLNDGDPTTTDDLGITGIWLMPIMESPSYHGYDVIDYNRIEPDYGTLADMRRLIEAAHERGIAVIVNMILNHTSRQNPWFLASAQGDPAYSGWYIWRPSNPNFRGADGQTVWHELRGRFYYGAFVADIPDLNLNNPEVTQELYDISRTWLNVVGVDGFRLDAIKWLIEEGRETINTESTHTWLNAYHDYLDTVNPEALTVGEVWDSNFNAAAYVPDGVDLTFDFDFASAILTAVNTSNPNGLRTIIEREQRIFPFAQYATFITNHDMNRVISQLRGSVDKARIAASLLLTTPGVPFLYYGEEIGMSGMKPDPLIRAPFRWDETATTAGFTSARRPWSELSDDPAGTSVAVETDDPLSLLSHYRNLIHLRTDHSALSVGDVAIIDVDGAQGVFAYTRQSEDESILVLMNMGTEPSTLALPPEIDLSTAQVLYGVSPDSAITTFDSATALPAFSTVIIQLSGE